MTGITLAVLLSACATGEGLRWSSASSEVVEIDVAAYSVRWIKDGSAINLDVRRLDAVFLPDALTEGRRAELAALRVAQRQCGNATLESSVEAKPNASSNQFRYRCG
jgi:hypothetical protein